MYSKHCRIIAYYKCSRFFGRIIIIEIINERNASEHNVKSTSLACSPFVFGQTDKYLSNIEYVNQSYKWIRMVLLIVSRRIRWKKVFRFYFHKILFELFKVVRMLEPIKKYRPQNQLQYRLLWQNRIDRKKLIIYCRWSATVFSVFRFNVRYNTRETVTIDEITLHFFYLSIISQRPYSSIHKYHSYKVRNKHRYEIVFFFFNFCTRFQQLHFGRYDAFH